MSEKKTNPYETVKGGRLTFKGGTLATRSKSIDKKKKKKHKTNNNNDNDNDNQQQPPPQFDDDNPSTTTSSHSGEVIYTIDAAKKMKYEDLFPVEAKKFGYDPVSAKPKSIEDALNDRVKKKADRYCK